MHASDYWPTPTAHQTNWEQNHNPYVYQYDPADDGPEWYTLRVILASHTPEELEEERFVTQGLRVLTVVRLACEIQLARHRLIKAMEGSIQ